MKFAEPLFEGAACAIVTPFGLNGEPDYTLLGTLTERQIENGTEAIVVCGTTGEASTLTDREREEAIRTVVEISAHRVPVIAGAGSNNTARSVLYAKIAEEAGADAILCCPPYYNKTTAGGLIRHFFETADAVSVPMLLYNVPSRCAMSIPIPTLGELARHPHIIGIKEASGDLSYAASLLARYRDTLDVYAGCDDLTVPYLSLGARGVISVLSNLRPGEVSTMCRNYRTGNCGEAAKAQLEFLPLIRRLFSLVNPIPVKYLMAKEGLCENVLRLPLLAADSLPQE